MQYNPSLLNRAIANYQRSYPHMPKPDQNNEIYIGMALIGTTGLLIGLVMDSPLLMVIATFLGLVVGGFVGSAPNGGGYNLYMQEPMNGGISIQYNFYYSF